MTDYENLTPSEQRFHEMLMWRGIHFIEDACERCHGSGCYAYSNTSTYGGGVGGQAITNGVCDLCWGSGDKTRPGLNLRLMRSLRQERDRILEVLQELYDGSVHGDGCPCGANRKGVCDCRRGRAGVALKTYRGLGK